MVIWLYLLCCFVAAEETASRLPIPDEAAQKVAFSIVSEAYEAEFANSKTPISRKDLAEKLIQDAGATNDDDAGRYVLLRVARDIAAGQGDIQTAFKAIDDLSAVFSIDELQTKADAALIAAKATKSPAEHLECAVSLAALMDDAVAVDRYDIAKPLAVLAVTSASKGKDADVLKRVASRKDVVDGIEREFKRTKASLERLATNPTDREANLTVGKFYGLWKGEWELGIPHLAQASDGHLKQLSSLELSEDADVLNVADGWWDFGETQKGIVKENVRAHATYWYKIALPNLSGLGKARVERRLDEVKPSSPAAKSSTTHKSSRKRLPVLVEIKILREGQWVSYEVSYDGKYPYITRLDGSKTRLYQDDDVLSWQTPSGNTFGINAGAYRTTSDEPVSFIYK
jgi:hypothetical protein